MRFPGFEGEWERTILGQIADVTKLAGYEFTKYVHYEDSGKVIALRGLNCKNGRLVLDDVKYIDNSDLSKLNRSKLFIGDVLFTYVGTVGEVAIIEENDRFYLAPNVSRIRFKDGYNPAFFKAQIGSKCFYDKVVYPLIATSSQPALSMENVRRFSISYPEKKEQDKIASFIEVLEERITIQSKVIEDLKKLKAALCSSLFSQGRTIAVALSDIGESFSTMNLSKEDLTDSGAECILYGELFTTYDRVIKDVKSHTLIETNEGVTISGLNDLLFPASTTVDAISLIAPAAISKPGVILGGDMFGIRLSAQYNNRYMSNLLYHCYRRELASYAQGSTIIHLHYKDIKRIKIQVHPKELQDVIANTLDLLDRRIADEQRISAYYTSQKTYLAGKMFI